MKNRIITAALSAIVILGVSGCAGQNTTTAPEGGQQTESSDVSSEDNGTALEDGTYTAAFTTDSSMFHINEAYDGRGELTVKDGIMTIHIVLPSQNIVNLFPGSAEEAAQEGAELLEPVEETVSYDDGTEEVVYAFDVPVPAIDEPFALALIGTKGKWYDHEVTVSDVEGTPAGDSDDAAAAQKVADLIDSIYVQTYDDGTDERCEEAKKAWDALTDAQKELVEGQYADPDYFGRDTGEASLDDPLNSDDIGEKELLVVSFGTSYNDSRAYDIGGIEKALTEAYPDWSVRRAFSSQIIINHILARDGEKIDNVAQALERAVDNNVKELVVLPTHLMHGAEYDELLETVQGYKDRFESVSVAEPLLGEVGSDEGTVNEDKKIVAEAVSETAAKESGFDSPQAAAEDGAAIVLLGHGTSHTAKITYDQMQAQVEALGYDNVFVGTVEGEPEDTSVEAVLEKIRAGGYNRVILRPLMVVAGDHAHNDMAGEGDDSWQSILFADRDIDSVEGDLSGMGRIPEIQELYISHAGAVIE